MNTKVLFIGVAILGLVAGLVFWQSQRGTSAPPRPALVGQPLLSPETLADAVRLELTGENGARRVVLEKREEGNWRLPEYHGLPVDFDKLRRFTQSLLNAKADRHVTGNPERIERLGLGRNVIELFGGDGESLWKLETGDAGASGGNFVRLSKADGAFLTMASIFTDTQSRNWPDKQPLRASVDDIAKVKVEFADDLQPIRFERGERGDAFTSPDLAENQSVKNHQVTSMVRTLLNGRFTEVVDSSDPEAVAAREQSRAISLTNFEGETKVVRVGRRLPKQTAAPASVEERARREREEISSSIVFDQDGNIISEEEIAALRGETPPPADAVEEEEPEEPGPVFVFYQGGDGNFIWAEISERVALQFGDHFFNQLPSGWDDLVETTEPEPSADERPETMVEDQPGG